MFKIYRTGELLDYLGITRDTLRFYEEKGLLNPKINSENNYRNYDIYDIYKIMSIDFYKKRGMTINQIMEYQNNEDIEYMEKVIESKKRELDIIINDAKCMIRRIEETQRFRNSLKVNLNVFKMKSLPLFKIKGEISEFVKVEEYKKVIDVINSNNDDMLSQIMRYISFDKERIIDTKMLIIDNADIKENDENILKYPRCLYTVVEEIHTYDEQEDLINKMHKLSKKYADEHNIRLLGVAFARVRLISYINNRNKTYIEIFIPIE